MMLWARQREVAQRVIEQAAERDAFYGKLKELDALADEFIADGIKTVYANSLGQRMKRIIGTFKYAPTPVPETLDTTP